MQKATGMLIPMEWQKARLDATTSHATQLVGRGEELSPQAQPYSNWYELALSTQTHSSTRLRICSESSPFEMIGSGSPRLDLEAGGHAVINAGMQNRATPPHPCCTVVAKRCNAAVVKAMKARNRCETCSSFVAAGYLKPTTPTSWVPSWRAIGSGSSNAQSSWYVRMYATAPSSRFPSTLASLLAVNASALDQTSVSFETSEGPCFTCISPPSEERVL